MARRLAAICESVKRAMPIFVLHAKFELENVVKFWVPEDHCWTLDVKQAAGPETREGVIVDPSEEQEVPNAKNATAHLKNNSTACLLVTILTVPCAIFAGLSTNALLSAPRSRCGFDFPPRFFSFSIFSFPVCSSNSKASFFFIAKDASKSMDLRTRTG